MAARYQSLTFGIYTRSNTTSPSSAVEPDYSAVIGTRNNNTPSRSSSLNSRDAVHHAFEDKSSGLDIAEGTTISYYTDNIDEDQPPPRTENSGSDGGTSKRELLQARAPPSGHDGVSAGAAMDNSTLTATDDKNTRRTGRILYWQRHRS